MHTQKTIRDNSFQYIQYIAFLKNDRRNITTCRKVEFTVYIYITVYTYTIIYTKAFIIKKKGYQTKTNRDCLIVIDQLIAAIQSSRTDYFVFLVYEEGVPQECHKVIGFLPKCIFAFRTLWKDGKNTKRLVTLFRFMKNIWITCGHRLRQKMNRRVSIL